MYNILKVYYTLVRKWQNKFCLFTHCGYNMVKKITSSLGSLEKEVMEICWKCKTATVRSVLEQIQKKRGVAYTTIMTIMSRLHAKGLLNRRQDDSGAYIYTPAEDKECFLARISQKAIKNLLHSFGELAVAQFLDVLENSRYNTAEWRKKLKKIR